jgi:amino acid transporter
MQITGMLIFLLVWLLILWVGSIALETTGLERSKARFQALSALSGTGFTTREAESIVNHPKRRRIASWLIFLGSVGIIAFILIMILYLRAGLAAPSAAHIIIIIASILVFLLLLWTGIINRLTSGIIKLFHKAPAYITEEILHQLGDYGIARIKVGETEASTGLTLGNTKFKERNIAVLAIERGEKVLSQPGNEEAVLAGDYLLCYGKISELSGLK